MPESTLVAPVSLAALVDNLRDGSLELEATITQVCDRIDAFEPTLQALLPEPDRRERLLREAAALRHQYPIPAECPPLYGVPVGVKDIMRARGFDTGAGSRVPPDVLAGPQAECVSQLRENGALVL